MFLQLMKKELKVYLSNKVNLVFLIILPILFIGLFSVALKDYIGADYGTFKDGKMFWYESVTDGEYAERFTLIKDNISKATGVTFEKVTDLEQAKNDVDKSKAFGVITVKADGYDYYRSPYNETEGGKLIRTMLVQLADSKSLQPTDHVAVIENNIEVNVNDVDSYAYYTFSAVAFTLMMLSVGIAVSIYDERENQTIERYRISNIGIWGMLGIKITVGMIAGLIQLVISFLFSSLVLGVNWGDKIGFMILLLLFHNLFAVLFAVMLGMKGKNKSVSQDIVMVITMLSAYLGGSVTPVYILENVPVLNVILKISPLYWTNQALISLYNDIVDEKTLYSALISVGLSLVIFIAIALGEKKKHIVRIEKAQPASDDGKEAEA